jgi:O-acetyl-ADP-ribose deacetylase
VIHAVGPVWNGGNRGEDEALASCYRRAMELCQTHSLASIAFPAISTGVYRFPADRAARIAVATMVDALGAAPVIERVIFCCFSTDSAALHAQAMAGFGSPCAD